MSTRELTHADMMVPGRILIKRRQLLKKVPLSERTILEMEKQGRFPKRFSISARMVVWDLAEVEAWITAHYRCSTWPLVNGDLKLIQFS